MSRWQVALRGAAYLVVLTLGVRWLWAAALTLQEPLSDSDAVPLGLVLGLRSQGTLWLAALAIGVKLMVGAYLVLTVMVAACALLAHGSADPGRLDAGFLLSVIAVMLTAAPWLMALRVPPATIDDLTLTVMGIAFAALSRPEFLADESAARAPREASPASS